MKKYFYLTIFMLMLLVACESSHLPDGVLTKRNLSEAVFNQRFSIAMNRDSLPEDLYLSICKKYKIERTTLEKSLQYYGKHTSEFIPIYDQVLNVLNEMEVNAKRDSVRPVHPGGFDKDISNSKKASPAAKSNAEIK